MTPVDQRVQRLMPGQGRTAAAGEQVETVVEAVQELLDRQDLEARCRELDRHRDAVEPPAHRGDGAAHCRR